MEVQVHCACTEVIDPPLLTPNPRNPNHHPKKQIELLAKIIQSQGWRAPVTVSNRSGFVVRGHGRLQAALLLGCKVPIDRQEYASEAEEWADLIADNRIAELAEIDHDELAGLLHELDGMDFDTDLTGYTGKQLDNILADIRQEAVKDDGFDAVAAAAEAVKAPRSGYGDVWLMGRHRLMCGDATKPEDMRRLMDGQKAAVIFTDPPYNVNYHGDTKDKMTIKNDNMSASQFQSFLTVAFSCLYSSARPGAAIYICHADSAGNEFREAMAAAGWTLKQCLIWVKNQFVIGRQDYQWQHEPILYGWRTDGSHAFYGGRRQGTIWEDSPITIRPDGDTQLICITVGTEQVVVRAKEAAVVSQANDALMTTWRFEKPIRNGDHPTMKPIPLCARAIQNSSKPEEIVLDSFGGSGSTLMAAEQTGRSCYTMEIDPIYADVILRRWEAFTGQTAEKLS